MKDRDPIVPLAATAATTILLIWITLYGCTP